MLQKSKNRTCPVCKSKSIAKFLYGMPIFSKKLIKDELEGRIVIGGCCISNDSPKYRCNKCGHEWGRLENHFSETTEKD